MEVAFTLIGWQFSIMLARPKTYPDLKLPTEDEIRAMIKEAYRRFREALRTKRENR